MSVEARSQAKVTESVAAEVWRRLVGAVRGDRCIDLHEIPGAAVQGDAARGVGRKTAAGGDDAVQVADLGAGIAAVGGMDRQGMLSVFLTRRKTGIVIDDDGVQRVAVCAGAAGGERIGSRIAARKINHRTSSFRNVAGADPRLRLGGVRRQQGQGRQKGGGG